MPSMKRITRVHFKAASRSAKQSLSTAISSRAAKQATNSANATRARINRQLPQPLLVTQIREQS